MSDEQAVQEQPWEQAKDDMCVCGHEKFWHSLFSDRWQPAASGCLGPSACQCKRFDADQRLPEAAPAPQGEASMRELTNPERRERVLFLSQILVDDHDVCEQCIELLQGLLPSATPAQVATPRPIADDAVAERSDIVEGVPMPTAAEYREQEIQRSIQIKFGNTNPKDRAYFEAQLPVYTEADYMDFAERYGDYVCDFEKASDRAVLARVAESHPAQVEVAMPGGGEVMAEDDAMNAAVAGFKTGYRAALATPRPAAAVAELVKAAEQAIEALDSCYNVTEYPADGDTDQDAAIASLAAALGRVADSCPALVVPEDVLEQARGIQMRIATGKVPEGCGVWFRDDALASMSAYILKLAEEQKTRGAK